MHFQVVEAAAPWAVLLPAEEKVGGDIEVVAQGEVLVDHLDSVRAGGPRAGARHLLAVDKDAAGVRADRSSEHLHQRGFAGPVVADESDHLPRSDPEVHPLEHFEGAETLADPSHLHAVACAGL